MASVRKRDPRDPDSPWVVEYTDARGKRHRATPKTGLKKDAETLRRKIEREIEEGKHKPVAETVTFKVAAETWLADCDRRRQIKDRMSGNTYDRIARQWRNHVVPAFGGYKLTDIRTPLVQEYVNKAIMTHSRGTVLAIFQQVYQILEFAVAKEWLTVHPLVSVRVRVPQKPGKPKLIPSVAELHHILAHLMKPKGPKDKHEPRSIKTLAITLALLTGMRRGEVLGLQWEDLDFEAHMINVRYSYSDIDGLKSTKTEAGKRSIPMAPPVYAILTEWRARMGQNATGHVILRNGHPLSPKKLSVWFWYMMRDAGMVDANGSPKYSLHTLRHCAVSLLIKEGLLPMHIQRMIGHASIKTTMDTYGHLMPGDDSGRVALASVAGQFSNITPKLAAFVETAPRNRDAARVQMRQISAPSTRRNRDLTNTEANSSIITVT